MATHDTHIIEPKQSAVGSVIWMHGLGANNHDFDPLVPELTQQGKLPIRFVFPNAPIRPVTINLQMPTRAWYDIYSLTHLDREDESGIQNSQLLIEQLIAAEIAQGIPANRIILAGFSQGGAMALHTGLRHQAKLAGILALSCYLPLFHQVGNAATDANKDTPIFIAHGSHDAVLPLYAGKIAHTTLNNTHQNIQWREYPMAHEISIQEAIDIKHWINDIFHTK